MSVECKVSRPKKLKINDDLISRLPDSLLHRILSLLPTDLAVSTSILSKRWKDLWMSTTSLDFDYYGDSRQRNYWPKETICQFIQQVLLYHASSITRFIFKSSYDFNATLVESWLSAAVQRQVQEIHLYFDCSVLSLPVSLCTSKILRVLEVKAYSADLCLPSMVVLPSLKILRLERVKFMDDLSFARLFSGLPCIEELAIYRCDWYNIKNAAISLPTLRRLRFNDNGMSNREGLVVNINAENLLNINCRRDLSRDWSIDTMPSLAHAYVYIDFAARSRGNAIRLQRAANLFGALCFAKSLHISGDSIGFLDSCCTLENINIFPMFVRLTTLKIEPTISHSVAALLMTIFRNAPLLESLVLAGEVSGGKWSKKPHPRCIEFNLRKCSLLRFDGHSGDILFLKFLLKTATTLEELKIHCRRRSCLWKEQGQGKKLKDIKKKLESVRRASKCCVVEFLDAGY